MTNQTSPSTTLFTRLSWLQKTAVATLIIGCLSFGALVADAYAQPERARERRERVLQGFDPQVLMNVLKIRQEVETIRTEVNLTDDQKAQVRAIVEATAPEAKALRESLRSSREAVKTQLVTNPSDTAALDALAKNIAATESDLVQLRVSTMGKIASVLSTEQRQTIAKGATEIRSLADEIKTTVRKNHPELPLDLF
ncbi:MAG: Spy/CpxP family protein refolding chaperone [Acidobacteria bacterium]|nr:Spy/CpxP family protein refolding chaperone [Acidobacteriota bacterium]